MKTPGPDRDPVHALEAFMARRDRVEPLADVAARFLRVPTALERWNAVAGVVRLDERGGSAAPVAPIEDVGATRLCEVVRRAGLLDMARSIRLAIQLGEILEALHNVGLVHGDVRSETVLVVGEDERVLLTPPSHLLTGRAGRPDPRAWDAPERADLVAFGALLNELLAGVTPRRSDGRKTRPRDGIPSVPLRIRRRGTPPPLERLVRELLSDRDLRHIDMSQVVNRLCIERERLRGRATRQDTVWFTPPDRRLVAGAVLAIFVAIGWLSAPPMPGLRRPSGPWPPPASITPAPPIATTPESAPPAGGPAVDAPAPPAPGPWPVLPRRTMDRAVTERGDVARRSAHPWPRGRAVDSESVSARQPGDRVIAAAPPDTPPPPLSPDASRLPTPAGAPPPLESPPQVSPPVEAVPAATAAVGQLPEAADGPARALASPTEAPRLAERRRDAEGAAAIDVPPAPPMAPGIDTTPDRALASVPEVQAAATPPPTSSPPEPAVNALLVRGALPASFEAGPSALTTGHGARGAAGMIAGGSGVARRPPERASEQHVSPSSRISAERFAVSPSGDRHSR
jgi:hypothetical protein